MQCMLAAAGDRVWSGAHARGSTIRRPRARRKRVFPRRLVPTHAPTGHGSSIAGTPAGRAVPGGRSCGRARAGRRGRRHVGTGAGVSPLRRHVQPIRRRARLCPPRVPSGADLSACGRLGHGLRCARGSRARQKSSLAVRVRALALRIPSSAAGRRMPMAMSTSTNHTARGNGAPRSIPSLVTITGRGTGRMTGLHHGCRRAGLRPGERRTMCARRPTPIPLLAHGTRA